MLRHCDPLAARASSASVSASGELIRAVGQGLEVAAVGGRLNYTLRRFRTSFSRVLYDWLHSYLGYRVV